MISGMCSRRPGSAAEVSDQPVEVDPGLNFVALPEPLGPVYSRAPEESTQDPGARASIGSLGHPGVFLPDPALEPVEHIR